MPKVSVIVPVYNVKNYIRECVESIINQTLQDIEIICVDDGSTDGSGEIVDEYAAKDGRVKVIHKFNGGYGTAMNIGMNSARGDYIGIVDGDDCVLPEMYETLYIAAKKADLDFVKSDHFLMYEGNLERTHDFSQKDYYNKVLTEKYRKVHFMFTMNTWTGIYKRKFIKDNNIRHNETIGASYQDNGFWIQTVSMCRKAEWLDKAFYMHRLDNPASSTRSRGKMMAVMNEFNFGGEILKTAGLLPEYRICNFFRMNGHKSTFYRIDDTLKKEYACIIKEDYERYKNAVNWDVVSRDNGLVNWLDNLSKNPEQFCNIEINKSQFLKKTIEESKNIIIYGTGRRAQQTFIKLMELGQLSKVLFAAVTVINGNKDFFGLKVRESEEIIPYKDNALVLISVTRKSYAYKEIKEHLEKLGIYDYCDTEEIYAV